MPSFLVALVTIPFWFGFGAAQPVIRWLADGSPRLRFYWENGPRLTFGKQMPQGKTPHVHLHHFIWGFPLTIASWALFAVDWNFAAWLLAGLAAALWYSEAKEIVLQKWRK